MTFLYDNRFEEETEAATKALHEEMSKRSKERWTGKSAEKRKRLSNLKADH
jgi:hypothetical protein